MKLLYDARYILVEDRFDGVSRYSHELAWALAAREGMEVTWLIHDLRQLDKLPKGEYLLANNPTDFLRETFTLAHIINAAGHTIVYSPFFMMGSLGKRYKLVLTIHDLIYFHYHTPPQWFAWYVRLGWRLFHLSYWPLRWQLNRADAVATVSDTARAELEAKQVTRRPITTVSNAVNADFAANEPVMNDSSQEIIYTGAFTPYKNVECLIDMMTHLPDMTLHLVSRIPAARRRELERYIQSRDVSAQIALHDGVSEQELHEILGRARCGISASRLEGFGLPVLESQAAGVPFVCADTPIFHEVGAKSVLYFDPDTPKQAAAQITKLANRATYERYVRLGHENIRRFSWSRSAEVAQTICEQLQHR